MTRKNCSPRADQRPVPTAAQSRAARQEHNNPATIEEFEREQMGLAAKE